MTRRQWFLGGFAGLVADPRFEAVAALADVPDGRARIATKLVMGATAPTYREVAEWFGISVGTVSQHLRRLRLRHPEAYAAIMAERRRQLAERHAAAVARETKRSERWYRKQAARHFRREHGRWPWEPAA